MHPLVLDSPPIVGVMTVATVDALIDELCDTSTVLWPDLTAYATHVRECGATCDPPTDIRERLIYDMIFLAYRLNAAIG